MSVYHSSFNYLGINSRIKNLIVVHFDGGDSGEIETGYQLEPIYTDSALGHRRYDYGSKYSSVATFRITVMKPDGSDMSEAEVRGNLKWLTGTMTNTQLELLVGEQIKCSFVGRITNVWQQKLDARTIGLVLEFTSISPFAYSPKQTIQNTVDGSGVIQINNLSDDLYSDIYIKTTYTNASGDSLSITNATTDETTTVQNLVSNETITIDGPMTISSDKSTRIFGDDFNFVFPKLVAGINRLEVVGSGNITFEFAYPIKLGNVALNVDELDGVIDCDSNPDGGNGVVVTEHTAWENIWDKPTTLKGFGVTDAYTQTEVNEKVGAIHADLNNTTTELSNEINTTRENLKNLINATNTQLTLAKADLEADILSASNSMSLKMDDLESRVYTKDEIDARLEEFVSDDVYTKAEVDAKLAELGDGGGVDESELNAMLAEVFGQ